MERNRFLAYQRNKIAYEHLVPENLEFDKEGTVLQDLRTFLSDVELEPFSTIEQDEFQQNLDQTTEKLQESLSANRKTWGLARQSINWFLFGAQYNRYLSEPFDLYKAEHCFELPLNKRNVDGLRRQKGGKELPEWPGMNLLTPELNDQYQQYAAELGDHMGVSRLHLEIFLWPGWET